MNKEKDKIAMLLDVNNFSGDHEGRLGPLLKFLLISAAPLLLWIYLTFPIRGIIFFPFYAVYILRVGLIVLGREKERMREFKKQLYDEYSSSADLLNIRTIHSDGLCEYVSGTVAYAILAANGTTYDDTERAQLIKAFIDCFGKDYDVDVYIQNITETRSLEERYKGVQLFLDADAAKDFIDIIDHNKRITCESSLITRIVFVVKAHKREWKDLRHAVRSACFSNAAKAFKDVHVATYEELEEVINRDVNGVVNIEEILSAKYTTHEYLGSRVLYYDDNDDNKKVVEEVEEGEENGFMIEE